MPFLAPIIAFVATATGVSVAVASSIVISVISLGVNFAIRLLIPRGRQRLSATGPETKGQIRAEVHPARWIVGRAKVGGALAYFGSRGRDARMVLVLSEGECEKIEKLWIDGEEVPLVRTASTKGDLLKPSSTSRFKDKITIREYFAGDGSQGSHLVSATNTRQGGYVNYDFDIPLFLDPVSSGTYEDDSPGSSWPVWTNQHKLNGLSWVYITLTQPHYGRDQKKRFWTHVPQFQFLVKGIKITWPGQTTKTWTDNAAAIRYWWETVRRGRQATNVDVTSFSSAYLLCEETVEIAKADLPSAYSDYVDFRSYKRYSINGLVTSGDDVGQVEDQMDGAWAGEVVEYYGRLHFRPGQDVSTSVMTIGDSDILTAPVASPWNPLQQRYNVVNSQIGQSRVHEYTELSLPQYVDLQAFLRDGTLRETNLALTYVTDPLTAGRLQAVVLRRARESLRVEVRIKPGSSGSSLGLVPTDRVTLTTSELGLTATRMEVERVRIFPDWTVGLTLREDLDRTYDDTLVLPPIISREINLESVAAPNLKDLAADEIASIADDGAVVVELVVSWTPSPSPETEVRVRLGANGDWQGGSTIGSNWRLSGVAAGQEYQIQARHKHILGVPGAWSSILTHTVGGDIAPPAAPTGFVTTSIPLGFRGSWIPPIDDDYASTCVYVGTTNVFSAATLMATVAADYYIASGLTSGTNYYVWLKAKDRSGNLSAPTSYEEVTPTVSAGDGASIFTGTDEPADDDLVDEKDGDLYIRADGVIWQRVNGVWIESGIDLTEMAGSTITTGAVAVGATPSVDGTTDGDIFVATDGRFWEWDGTSWIYQGDLTGPEGAEGPEGVKGPPGGQGDPGLKGIMGNSGIKGEPGEQGNPGVKGDLGAKGVKGVQGIQGTAGPKGGVGAKGVKGVQGIQGTAGLKGGVGGKGGTGVQGIQGIAGPKGGVGGKGGIGVQGIQGTAGPKGGVGGKGLRGVQGIQGTAGPKGGVGGRGDKGGKGTEGSMGGKGDVGGKGNKGGRGVQGSTGPDGGVGGKGLKGVQGIQGSAGTKGLEGDRVFVFYTNAPQGTNPEDLEPLAKTADGNWTTASGYLWYASALDVP